jgi:predicted membrane protein
LGLFIKTTPQPIVLTGGFFYGNIHLNKPKKGVEQMFNLTGTIALEVSVLFLWEVIIFVVGLLLTFAYLEQLGEIPLSIYILLAAVLLEILFGWGAVLLTLAIIGILIGAYVQVKTDRSAKNSSH